MRLWTVEITSCYVADDDEECDRLSVQNCIEVLELLRRGDLGQVTQEIVDDYRTQCHTVFPYATAFMLALPNGTVDDTLADSDATAAAAADTDGVDCVA